MKYIITGKNIDVTEGLKSAIEDKLDKLDRYFNKETEVIQTQQFAKDYDMGIPGLPDDYISIIANRLHTLYARGIMSNADYSKFSKDTTQMIRIINGKVAVSSQISTIYSTVSAYEFIFAEP